MNGSSLDLIKKNARQLGLKLRTLLKLPKAHRWACYEWFTANIDLTLLSGENDFRHCLKELFPDLQSRNLTRAEWCKIRKLMGKPRRCSQAFLDEERALLHAKRKKIRQLQQQKVIDISHYRDLPEQIPLSLVIGMRVTALLHEPYDGLFVGTIDAVETANHGYRITFDRPNIGTLTVPDYEVLSEEPAEFLPLTSFQTRIKPRMPILKSSRLLEVLGSQLAEAINQKQDSGTRLSFSGDEEEESCGDYPIRLLALMVKVSKILLAKKKRISRIKSMNDDVERIKSLTETVPAQLKRSYAAAILDLEKLNADLDDHLKAIQLFTNDLPIDSNLINDTETLKQNCQVEAKQAVDRVILDYKIENQNSIDVIHHMMSVLYHLKSLAETKDNALQLKALSDTISDYKIDLNSGSARIYEDNIEIHLKHIQNFSSSSNSKIVLNNENKSINRS